MGNTSHNVVSESEFSILCPNKEPWFSPRGYYTIREHQADGQSHELVSPAVRLCPPKGYTISQSKVFKNFLKNLGNFFLNFCDGSNFLQNFVSFSSKFFQNIDFSNFSLVWIL